MARILKLTNSLEQFIVLLHNEVIQRSLSSLLGE
jgi:hypothetical protein